MENNGQNKEQNKEQTKLIYEINGFNTFVKVKRDALPIGKVMLAFVEYDKNTGKQKKVINIYMDKSDALKFANDILSGKIEKAANASYEASNKYPSPFWQSKLGGVNEANCKARKLRSDGKALSRTFTLSVGALKDDGTRNPYVITANQQAAHSAKNGIIIPEKGRKPELTIRVPVTVKEDLEKMALEIQAQITAFYASEFLCKSLDGAKEEIFDQFKKLNDVIMEFVSMG